MLCLYCLEEIVEVEGKWVHCSDGEEARGYCCCSGQKHRRKEDGCPSWHIYHKATPVLPRGGVIV